MLKVDFYFDTSEFVRGQNELINNINNIIIKPVEMCTVV